MVSSESIGGLETPEAERDYGRLERMGFVAKTAGYTLLGATILTFGGASLKYAEGEPSVYVIGTALLVSGAAMTVAAPTTYYLGDPDLSPHRLQ